VPRIGITSSFGRNDDARSYTIGQTHHATARGWENIFMGCVARFAAAMLVL
jgi:hypothetical protein